ncbi:TadE/TadG family type IV pilus assembly protein [Georgenia sp. SUBG003]|uniref:TadE/TadG family type IV pilus assembly protein n=1 Tax=Georgenia sp. SUBG003 TaxID=1497974 RepID=UPI003AB403B1
MDDGSDARRLDHLAEELEFALVLPILLLLVFGITEFGAPTTPRRPSLTQRGTPFERWQSTRPAECH